MPREWKRYTRISSPNHSLEIKISEGGELYGHAQKKCVAIKGQWLCRNTENGHTWVSNEESVVALYRPLDSDDQDYKDLVLKINQKSKKDKKSSDETSSKISSSYDPKEFGPLFFGGDSGETKER